MKIVIFEGSTAEFVQVANQLGFVPNADLDQMVSEPTDIAEEPVTIELSVEQIKNVLARRPLDAKMRIMFNLLYKAGDTYTSSDDLKEALDFEGPQYRGMMGAFGRRLVNTPGMPADVRLIDLFFDAPWDHSLHQKKWRLTENTRRALEELRLLDQPK